MIRSYGDGMDREARARRTAFAAIVIVQHVETIKRSRQETDRSVVERESAEAHDCNAASNARVRERSDTVKIGRSRRRGMLQGVWTSAPLATCSPRWAPQSFAAASRSAATSPSSSAVLVVRRGGDLEATRASDACLAIEA